MRGRCASSELGEYVPRGGRRGNGAHLRRSEWLQGRQQAEVRRAQRVAHAVERGVTLACRRAHVACVGASVFIVWDVSRVGRGAVAVVPAGREAVGQAALWQGRWWRRRRLLGGWRQGRERSEVGWVSGATCCVRVSLEWGRFRGAKDDAKRVKPRTL